MLHRRHNRPEFREGNRKAEGASLIGLRQWLRETQRDPEPYATFSIADISEVAPPDDGIKRYLAGKLLAARLDPEFLAAAAAEVSWDDVQRLVDATMPHGEKVRRGLLGEVMAADWVGDPHEYMVPVAKFRFAASSEVSPPATDVLALRVVDDDIAEVCYVESKLRTGWHRTIAVEGARQLAKDQSVSIPQILTFSLARLEESHSDLFGPLARYSVSRADHPAVETSRLFLVNERSAWSDNALLDLHEALSDPPEFELASLTVHVLLVDSLGPLSDQLLASIQIGALSDDD